MTTSGMSRLHRLRELAYAPLAVAVTAGTICTGVGTEVAATPQSGDTYDWYLFNRSGKPIYGTWNATTSPWGVVAFNIADGTVISELHRRHRAVEFKKFLTA
ncbi:hypothetical protein, partial [Rhodococcus jostii]|uniref:hypothetical protein n=1 Tax=Rhodococcus jostii TaxID=132919 RepID=UPI0036539947